MLLCLKNKSVSYVTLSKKKKYVSRMRGRARRPAPTLSPSVSQLLRNKNEKRKWKD